MRFPADFECTPRIQDFVYEIADEMVRLFGIPPAEAAGRINRQWCGQRMLEEVDELSLFHNDADHWANLIYYGHDGLWRSRKYGPQPPLPYP
jgi:hypothetical protein